MPKVIVESSGGEKKDLPLVKADGEFDFDSLKSAASSSRNDAVNELSDIKFKTDQRYLICGSMGTGKSNTIRSIIRMCPTLSGVRPW